MTQAPQAGPRLSDEAFFTQLIDTSRPGLAGIPAAVAAGNYAEARRLFAAEVRATLQPERFFRLERSFRGNHFMYPGESVEEAAERILRLELISCSTPHQFKGEVDWFANPTYNQYREWTWQLSRHAEWALLAERYRATGDERFAEGFVTLFRSWVRQAVAPDEDAPGNATLCWRTIETGIRMGGAWQWALHSFYRSPRVTDDDLVDWYKSVWEHGRRLRYNHWTHNWLIMEMNGLAQIGILYPQLRDAPAWKAYAFETLVDQLSKQVYPDGFQFELSTNYHQVNISNYQWLWDLCLAYDEPVPEGFRSGLELMHAANVRIMMPDGRLPDLNDGRWRPVAPLLQRAAQLYPERADFRWAASAGREGTPPAETSLAFPYAGYIVFRTSWAPDAIWALLDGGPFGYAHQHEDKLNVLLHAYGHLLLTEGGNYAYDSSEMRRYVLSTRAHNTIRVDGQDQNRRLHFDRTAVADLATPSGARWHFSAAYDAAEAAYDEGYGPAAVRSVTHQRRLIFLKSDRLAPGPCLLVIDRLYPNDDAAHTYQALWHFEGENARANACIAESTDTNRPNLAIIIPENAGVALELVCGQEEPEWQGWKSILDSQQGQYAPAPTATCSWSATGPTRLVTLLYPMQAGASCPIRAIDAEPSATVTRITLHTTGGTTYTFDESSFAIEA